MEAQRSLLDLTMAYLVSSRHGVFSEFCRFFIELQKNFYVVSIPEISDSP